MSPYLRPTFYVSSIFLFHTLQNCCSNTNLFAGPMTMFHFGTELSDVSVAPDLHVNASAMLLLPAILKTGRMFKKLNKQTNKQTNTDATHPLIDICLLLFRKQIIRNVANMIINVEVGPDVSLSTGT